MERDMVLQEFIPSPRNTSLYDTEKRETIFLDGAPCLNASVSFIPEMTTIINEIRREHRDYFHRFIQTRLHIDSPISFYIDYDFGPSCDPFFKLKIIQEGASSMSIGHIPGEHLVIPGDGSVRSDMNGLPDRKVEERSLPKADASLNGLTVPVFGDGASRRQKTQTHEKDKNLLFPSELNFPYRHRICPPVYCGTVPPTGRRCQ